MSSTASVFRAARPMFRQQANFLTRNAALRHQRGAPRFGQQGSKRWQSSTAEGAQQQGWFKRMWESEVGLKTVHFWAPVMKWCLVLAGIADFARPAENLSFTQNFALTTTGLIWTRWCMIIKPRNILLATVNFFLAIVGIVQVSRIAIHHYGQKEDGAAAAVEEVKSEVKEGVESVKEAVKP